MKKIIISSIFILVSVISWWLLSPLFINVEVNEAVPISLAEHEKIKNSMQDSIIKDVMPTSLANENKKLGSFIDGDSSHKVSGDLLLLVNKDSSYLRFENFDSTNGPDLYVVLSSNKNPKKDGLGKMLIIEKLKGNKGNQNYSLKGISLNDYESVLIYCKAFSVVFGYASIKE